MNFSANDLLLLGSLGLIFAPLEHLWPAGPRDWSPGRLCTDALHVFVGGFLIRWGIFGATLVVGALLKGLMPDRLPAVIRSQSPWLQFAELLVLSDVGFYFGHRLVHSVPWLWRCHEVHHSSERLDWLSTYRVHPVDQVFNSTIISLPGLALGFAPTAFLAYATLYRFHAMLLHSNLRLSFGWLNRVVASPHFHHWHHANDPAAYDKNFGGQLVILDWLFGTLNMPQNRPVAFGIVEKISPRFLGQIAHPFQRPTQPVVVGEKFA